MVFLPILNNLLAMKNLLTIAFLCTISLVSKGQNRSITFETSTFEEVKAKAKKENKLIFVDAYTTWCGPCKWMAKTVFTNDTVADYFNSNFISTKIDMEKGEGIEFRKKYNVFCFPNLLFIDANGEVIHRRGGGMPPANFIAFAKEAQGSSNTYQAFAKEYETKKSDALFLSAYLEYMSKTCVPYEEVVANYFNTQSEDQLTSRANWNMFYAYAKTYNNKAFNHVTNNLNTYYTLYTKDSVNLKLQDVLYKSGQKALFTKKNADSTFTVFKTDIAKYPEQIASNVLFHLDLDKYASKKEWNSYGELLLNKGDLYLTAKEHNGIAWKVFENVENSKVLEKASQWMKKYIDENQNSTKTSLYAEYDTYASLLFKLKLKNEALAAANEAIQQAKAFNSDYESTLKLIENIKKL
jgi:thioredoxin-related protein